MNPQNLSNPVQRLPLFSEAFLLSVWANDYADYCANGQDNRLIEKLSHWTEKHFQIETVSESGFVQTFFVDLWGYTLSGAQAKGLGYTLEPQFPIDKAGQNGGQGKADLALGWFGNPEFPSTPQVLGEFKDVRSGLDKAQHRKGNDRSPVKQCADYLKFASEQFTPFGNEKIQPTWGIVTDMQEFRLYWKPRMPQQYECFVIADLLGKTENARRQRFLFSRLFHRDWLLNRSGESPLQALLSAQRVRESKLEKGFYFEYRDYRAGLYQTLLMHNPNYRDNPRQLVRLSQKLLDRFLFVLFCEDMGQRLDFPINLLRDILIKESQDANFDPDDTGLWDAKIKRLFRAMRDGTPFKPHSINRFNGGLFAEDTALDGLSVPNKVFCTPNQGSDAPALQSHQNNLLYFAANYNFGVEDGGENAIGLYTLGRIFEQSITDLEIMEAEAAGTTSLMKLSKRKTDGVYYTPEWVTAYIVEETLGLRLKEIRAALGEADFAQLDAAQIHADHGKTTGKVKQGTLSFRYLAWLDGYEQGLSQIKVLDPACGSGAFLIQALKRLLQEYEWITSERERVSYAHRQTQVFDFAKAYGNILTHNLFGVDINAESVEITKLALWLHTALPGQPLSSLDDNILCGNSLVDWDIEAITGPLTDEQRQRINPFSFAKSFAAVFAVGGFDVIIGNPPYIKLQNMRLLQPEATDYWVKARRPSTSEDAVGTKSTVGRNKPVPAGVSGKMTGQMPETVAVRPYSGLLPPPKLLSTQTGNYDIYLPFIEHSISLLQINGRMGFIAPNVWAVNEYGSGLREMLHATRQLERWVDFKSHQIFDEAITYTALQFFTGKANDGIKLHFAPKGNSDLAALDWANVEALPYEQLPKADAWQFMPIAEQALIEKLGKTCKRLDDKTLTTAIFQGLKTGGDSLFIANQFGEIDFEFESPSIVQNKTRKIEKEIMFPVISGNESKRYALPLTNKSILFPYVKVGEKAGQLYDESYLQTVYPLCWKYLSEREEELKAREKGKLDVGGWYQFSRNQGIKQMSLPKLLVAGTAPELRVCADSVGGFAFMGGRVYGILPTNLDHLYFLEGMLNSAVLSFIFKRIARPKEGGYFDIETQFIAPLPIPNATPEQKKQVAELAENLQTTHTAYRDALQKLDKRLAHSQMTDDSGKQSPRWIWSDLPDVARLKNSPEALAGLKGAALTAWAKQAEQTALDAKLQKLALRLNPNARLTVCVDDGEVILQAEGVSTLSVFADEDEAAWIAAQWRQVLRTNRITPSMTAGKLLDLLLRLKQTDNASLRQQVLDLDCQLDRLKAEIAVQERAINALIHTLYQLTADEIAVIERG